MKVVIYGAQSIALGVYTAIKELFPKCDILCFLVTSMENNPRKLKNLPVYELKDFTSALSKQEKNNIKILISTPDNFMDEIEMNLNKSGLYNYVRIDSQRWASMQMLAFIRLNKYIPLCAYPVGCKKPDLRVYKIVHSKDKALHTSYNTVYRTETLQVGAYDAYLKIGVAQDDCGDNISKDNGNYCELTGLYWIWKNVMQGDTAKEKYPWSEISNYRDKHDCVPNYYGLVHYRRFLDLSSDDELRLIDNNIDVILPYPMQYEPYISKHLHRYLKKGQITALFSALKELRPEYYRVFLNILRCNYMYNYNIIIAKENVLRSYCEWLFPILKRIETIYDAEHQKEADRYIGYIGEMLESLYFMYNKDNLTIVHSGLRFLT